MYILVLAILTIFLIITDFSTWISLNLIMTMVMINNTYVYRYVYIYIYIDYSIGIIVGTVVDQ